MTNKLILPPTYLQTIDNPLIFLAGPIQGSYNWHNKAIEIIKTLAPELYIASPRGNLDAKCRKNGFTAQMCNERIDWTTYHLKKAGKNGTVLFWLAKEFEHSCDEPYAQITGIEFGECKEAHKRDGIHMVVGIEEDFTNSFYIKRILSQDCPNVPIYLTLEETCSKAIQLARLK